MSCLYKPSPTVKNMDMVNLTTAYNSNSWGGGEVNHWAISPSLSLYSLPSWTFTCSRTIQAFLFLFSIFGPRNSQWQCHFFIIIFLFQISIHLLGGIQNILGPYIGRVPSSANKSSVAGMALPSSIYLWDYDLSWIFHQPLFASRVSQGDISFSSGGGDLSQYAGGVSFPPWQQLLPFSDSEKWNKVPCC